MAKIIINFDDLMGTLYPDKDFSQERVSDVMNKLQAYSQAHRIATFVVVQDNSISEMEHRVMGTFLNIFFSGSETTVSELIKSLIVALGDLAIVSDTHDFAELAAQENAFILTAHEFYEKIMNDSPVFKTKVLIYGLDQLPFIIDEFMMLMQKYHIFALKGSLGAGKTTLIRSLLQVCGVTGVISSPTFNYVNIYTNAAGQRIYHFDLYRIQNMQEFIDAGFDEYLNDPDAYVFIEWPEVIEPLLAGRACFFDLDYVGENQRSITIRSS